ncbi:MAG: hypothetical protein AB1414_11945 [bacterium]
MKKIIILIFTILVGISLSGCSNKHLENEYFENTKDDSFDEFYQMFSKKLSLASNQLHTFYPRSSREVIWYEDSYVNAQLFSKEDIYKHEFYNYTLSDDRQFMYDSNLYYLDDMRFSKTSIENSYDEIEEGKRYFTVSETYDGNTVKDGLQFFMEDEELYFDFYYTVNQTTLFHYTFHFYVDENLDDVMEMTLHFSNIDETSYTRMSYTKLIFGVSEETYICNSCNNNSTEDGSLEYIYTEFNDDQNSFEFSNVEAFIRIDLSKNNHHGTIFNGLTGERYDVRKSEGEYMTDAYYEYIRNTNLVSYSPIHFKINLLEILGWDKLTEIDIPNETNTYQLYYGDDLLSEDYHSSIEYEHSEYPYFEYHTEFDPEVQILNEIITLDIFGLSSGYSKDYFENKFQQGPILYQNELINHNLDKTYDENYEFFMQYINYFR